MQLFKLSPKYSVVCRAESTRSGFRHLATLLAYGQDLEEAKRCYQNRTWESYGYQSVLNKLVNNSTCLTDKEKKRFQKRIKFQNFCKS